jgi:hypothetical protein
VGSVFNRRNALVGWVVLKTGKRSLVKGEPIVPVRRVVAVAVATTAGVVLFWRRRSSSSTE